MRAKEVGQEKAREQHGCHEGRGNEPGAVVPDRLRVVAHSFKGQIGDDWHDEDRIPVAQKTCCQGHGTQKGGTLDPSAIEAVEEEHAEATQHDHEALVLHDAGQSYKEPLDAGQKPCGEANPQAKHGAPQLEDGQHCCEVGYGKGQTSHEFVGPAQQSIEDDGDQYLGWALAIEEDQVPTPLYHVSRPEHHLGLIAIELAVTQ